MGTGEDIDVHKLLLVRMSRALYYSLVLIRKIMKKSGGRTYDRLEEDIPMRNVGLSMADLRTQTHEKTQNWSPYLVLLGH